MKGVIFTKGLSGNALKIIALVAMTADHIGAWLFPNAYFLRVIGRVALPIFAFMIAEGCFYTKRKLRYFSLVFGVGAVCVLAYLIFIGELYLNILITFSFSIIIIYALDYALKGDNPALFILPALAVSFSFFVNFCMPIITGEAGCRTDYGFIGTLLPAFIYFFKDFKIKLLVLSVGLTLLALSEGALQWWAFLSLPFMVFYDGTRGKYRLKYLFYLYYPLHFIVLYLIGILL